MYLQIRVRKDSPRPPPPPPAAAKLDVGQLQELADRTPDLLAAAGSAELGFEVSVTLTGDISNEERAAVDAALAEISDDLKSA